MKNEGKHWIFINLSILFIILSIPVWLFFYCISKSTRFPNLTLIEVNYIDKRNSDTVKCYIGDLHVNTFTSNVPTVTVVNAQTREYIKFINVSNIKILKKYNE